MTPVAHNPLDNCPICIEPIKPGENIAQTTCNHFFHQRCIDQNDLNVSIQDRVCSVCRKDRRVYFSTTQPYKEGECPASDDPLIQACRNSDMEKIREAFSKDNGIVKNKFFNENIPGYATLLDCASFCGNLDIVAYLIENGADPNSTRSSGSSPLDLAAQNGKDDVVEYLLTKGADHRQINQRGEFPLLIAAKNGHLTTVKLLVSKGADINNKSCIYPPAGRGALPVSKPMDLSHAQVAEEFNSIHSGSMIAALEMDELTALMVAAEEGHAEIVKYLLEQGADINAKCGTGSTAYTKATKKQRENVLAILRSRNAEPVEEIPVVASLKEKFK